MFSGMENVFIICSYLYEIWANLFLKGWNFLFACEWRALHYPINFDSF